MNENASRLPDIEGELVFLFSLRDLIFNGDIVAVIRPDGQIGYMPAPQPDDVYICRMCGGSGFLSDNMAALVTADWRLTNLCPDCNGTGIDERQPFLDDELPETQELPRIGGAS